MFVKVREYQRKGYLEIIVSSEINCVTKESSESYLNHPPLLLDYPSPVDRYCSGRCHHWINRCRPC